VDAIGKANNTADAGTIAVEETIADVHADMETVADAEAIADISSITHTNADTGIVADATATTITDPDTSTETAIPLQPVALLPRPLMVQRPLERTLLILFQLARE